jgi:hypothetical protein
MIIKKELSLEKRLRRENNFLKRSNKKWPKKKDSGKK